MQYATVKFLKEPYTISHFSSKWCIINLEILAVVREGPMGIARNASSDRRKQPYRIQLSKIRIRLKKEGKNGVLREQPYRIQMSKIRLRLKVGRKK